MLLPSNTRLCERYRIVRPIAQGGMGVVYQAHDEHLGITVALKQTIPGEWANPQQREAIRRAVEREARLLATLRHPALPKVMDYFVTNAGYFTMMEFIPGDDLGKKLVQRGAPFPIDDVLFWADQILQVLDYLHNQPVPIIHHDIKPQNIKVLDDGQVVLLDFGLAKGMVASHTQLLQPSSAGGYTVDYAPLEQVQGTGTTPQTDLYALGATLYHLLSGSPLPPATDALSRAAAPFNNQPDPLPPLIEVNPTVPVEVSKLVMQALALRPEDRPPSAAAMRAALREVKHLHLPPLTAGQGGVRSPPQSSFTASPAVRPGASRSGEDRLPIQGMLTRRLGNFSVHAVAFSPDGQLLASAGEDRMIWLWDLASGRVIWRLKGHTDIVSCVCFSPNGRVLVSGSADQTVRLWEVASGREIGRWSGHTFAVGSVAFSPDGRLVASGSDDCTVRLWNVTNGAEVGRMVGQEHRISSVAFSPDGRLLALGHHGKHVQVWDIANGRMVVQINGHRHAVLSVTFSPDGKWLASSSRDATVRIWSVPEGQELRRMKGHGREVGAIAFSPDGLLLASASGDRTVRIWESASGRNLVHLRGNERGVNGVAFSPDGSMVVSGGEDGTLRLWGLRVPSAVWDSMTQTWHEEQKQHVLRAMGRCEICGQPLGIWEKILGLSRCRSHSGKT